jgi:hypothetical protein
MNDLTTSYFSIEKSDKQPDGTLMVYGKATDDSIDIDQQICDAAWLDRAMPAWFKSGGNIREQHSSIAAGVAKEYEVKADGHYIMAHVVDPVSVKKVDAGVLRGFSIGIKSPRVVRDQKAANGRIIDGQIVEVSLVDRPANPNCQLVLAKSVDGESSLIQVEELTEIQKHGSHNQSAHGRRGAGGGAGGGGGANEKTQTEKQKQAYNDANNLLADISEQHNSSHIRQAKAEHRAATIAMKVGNKPMARERAIAAADKIRDGADSTTASYSTDTRIKLSQSATKYESKMMEAIGTDADVEKHGSHNQSSHGRRGAGGGAGGAGGGFDAPGRGGNTDSAGREINAQRDDQLVSKAIDDTEDVYNEIDNLSDENDPSFIDNFSDDDDMIIDESLDSLKEAQQNLQNAYDAPNMTKHYDSLENAQVRLDETYDALKNADNRTLKSLADKVDDIGGEVDSYLDVLRGGEGEKSTKASIKKHGSHNQSSHGRRGAGGGAGGGGAAVAGPKTPPKVVNQAIDSAESRVDDAYKEIVVGAGPKPSTSSRVMNAAQMRDDASSHIADAKSNITRGKESAAASSLRNAADSLKDEPKFNPARQGLRDLADQVESGFKKVPNKSTNAELRKALQFALESLSLNKSEENPMQDTVVELPTEAVGDLLKFDKTQYEAAREALANLIAVEAGEMREGHNELQSIAHLLEAVAHLHAWYEGEEAEGEVMEEETIIERAADAEMEKEVCKMCKKSEKMCKCEGGYKAAGDDEVDAEKGAEPNPVPSQETYATLQGTVIVQPTETPKSAEAEEPVVEEAPAEEPAVEETPAEAPVEEAVTEDSEAKTEVDAADVEAIVEQVVKSATESLRAEIASLVAAKEAALEKSVGLESELAIAKSLAVAGGPSRTVKPLSTKINDNLTKAAIYKAKANATTDPVLAKGYKQLAEEFFSKASDSDNK